MELQKPWLGNMLRNIRNRSLSLKVKSYNETLMLGSLKLDSSRQAKGALGPNVLPALSNNLTEIKRGCFDKSLNENDFVIHECIFFIYE